MNHGVGLMPDASYEIRMSWRGMQRGRAIVAIASRDGEGVEGFRFYVEVDDEGSFSDESDVKRLDVVTKTLGYAFVTWWQWPQGSSRDLTSVVRAVWDDPAVSIYLDNDDG
jgi:hypothetical protein